MTWCTDTLPQSGATTLVVASPHQVQEAPGAGWQPFGRRHALQPGSSTTECGQPAHTWRAFPDLSFDPGHAKACPTCALSDRLRGEWTDAW